jgi:hypothetical protein
VLIKIETDYLDYKKSTMEILVNRRKKTKISTISDVLIDGVFFCFGLEDLDRGLNQKMPIAEIRQKKVFGQTAIPAGRYEMIINFSNRFQQYMPLLLNVPGFEGVRIHAGNKAANTEGCLLLGQTEGVDFIGNSRLAYRSFLSRLRAVEKKEKIFITFK